MPYTAPTEFNHPTNRLPQHLQHKPVYALPYQWFDGPFDNTTDMRYLSVGISQYDSQDVSVKTMRHVDGRWSRQAEELPLHRPLDLTLFLAKVIFDRDLEGGVVSIPVGMFQNQEEEISITPEDRTPEENRIYEAVANRNPLLVERFISLRDFLNGLRLEEFRAQLQLERVDELNE